MAERRMFAKTIIMSDAFLDMPATARCLYFTLAMMADDDGFVNSPKSIMRQSGASQDDMTLLIQKRFVLAFDDGVIVIKHWRIHNYIQNDRRKGTTYTEHMAELTLDDKKAYILLEDHPEAPCIQNGYKVDTQVRLGKDSLGKDSNKAASARKFVPPTVDEVAEYCKERGNNIDAESFVAFYEANGWVQGRGQKPIKNWKACVQTWERREQKRNAGNGWDDMGDIFNDA